MKRKDIYLALCVPGIILPYYFMSKFFMDNPSLDPGDLGDAMFGNAWVAFLMMDLFVTAVVFLAFLFTEGRRLGMKKLWAPVLAVGLVGISLAFPLFLYMREIHFEKQAAKKKNRANNE